MPAIRTPRLLLVPGALELLRADLESSAALGRALACEVPECWPPEFYDADAIRWTMNWPEQRPDHGGWSFYYVLEPASETSPRPRLAGAGGFKGPPTPDGTVEIGYAIVADRRRRGYARETVDAMLAFAFAHDNVERVIAHTLPHLAGSIGVLRSAGFAFTGSEAEPDEPDAIRYDLLRGDYEHVSPPRASVRILAHAHDLAGPAA